MAKARTTITAELAGTIKTNRTKASNNVKVEGSSASTMNRIGKAISVSSLTDLTTTKGTTLRAT